MRAKVLQQSQLASHRQRRQRSQPKYQPKSYPIKMPKKPPTKKSSKAPTKSQPRNRRVNPSHPTTKHFPFPTRRPTPYPTGQPQIALSQYRLVVVHRFGRLVLHVGQPHTPHNVQSDTSSDETSQIEANISPSHC